MKRNINLTDSYTGSSGLLQPSQPPREQKIKLFIYLFFSSRVKLSTSQLFRKNVYFRKSTAKLRSYPFVISVTPSITPLCRGQTFSLRPQTPRCCTVTSASVGFLSGMANPDLASVHRHAMNSTFLFRYRLSP